jgi:hypothetical protein
MLTTARAARRGVGALLAASVFLLSVQGTGWADGTGVGCGSDTCGVGATDPGSPGSAPGTGASGTGASGGGTSGGGTSGSGTSGSGTSGAGTSGGGTSGGGTSGGGSSGGGGGSGKPVGCGQWYVMNPQPAAGSAVWEGHSAADGVVEFFECDGGGGGISQAGASTFRFTAKAAAAAPGKAAPAAPPPPPVDPAVVAQKAYRLIPITDPAMHFGPDSAHVAARYWLYLWTDNPGPITRTATTRNVTVSATATLESVTWSMGAPSDVAYLGTVDSPVVCKGAGTPPPANADTTVDPRPNGYCAYMYQVRSTDDRTGGAGSWPVTASATWRINWKETAGGNATGTITAPPFTSATAVCVGAWYTIAVDPKSPPPQNAVCGSQG